MPSFLQVGLKICSSVWKNTGRGRLETWRLEFRQQLSLDHLYPYVQVKYVAIVQVRTRWYLVMFYCCGDSVLEVSTKVVIEI